MKTKLHTLTFLLLGTGIFTSSCLKDNPVDETNTITFEDQQNATYVLKVEQTVNELEFIARSFKTSYPNQPGILIGANIVQGVTEEGKKKYDITFNNLTGLDSRTRNGVLTVVFEDAVENGQTVEGKHLHVRSDNENSLYSVDGIKFKGSLVFSNVANRQNSENNIVSHINPQSFLIAQNGEEVRFSSSRKSKFTAGFASTDISDDQFQIYDQEYSLSVLNTATKFLEAATVTAVNLKYSCTQKVFIPSKGTMSVEHVGGKTRHLVFGNDNCSDLPVVAPAN